MMVLRAARFAQRVRGTSRHGRRSPNVEAVKRIAGMSSDNVETLILLHNNDSWMAWCNPLVTR